MRPTVIGAPLLLTLLYAGFARGSLSGGEAYEIADCRSDALNISIFAKKTGSKEGYVRFWFAFPWWYNMGMDLLSDKIVPADLSWEKDQVTVRTNVAEHKSFVISKGINSNPENQSYPLSNGINTIMTTCQSGCAWGPLNLLCVSDWGKDHDAR